MKPQALDLFCGAGGATRGLQMAGFHVTGVDINPQPRYVGDRFVRANALAPPFDLGAFDFIWASPPCQAFTPLRNLTRRKYANIIPPVRSLLRDAGVLWVIENVTGAPLGESGYLVTLCGTMFGLATRDGSAEVRRHRLFETNFSVGLQPACQHDGTRRSLTITGHTPQINVVRNRIRKTFPRSEAGAAVGIDWMSMKGLSQAIPPAYAEFIGREALKCLRR